MKLAESGNVFSGWFDKIFGGDKNATEAANKTNGTASCHLVQVHENEPQKDEVKTEEDKKQAESEQRAAKRRE